MWSGNSEQANVPPKARIFTPRLQPRPFPTSAVRLELDATANEHGPAQLDAVRLLGHFAPPWIVERLNRPPPSARSTVGWSERSPPRAPPPPSTWREPADGSAGSTESREELRRLHQRLRDTCAAFEKRQAEAEAAVASSTETAQW